MEAGKPGLHRRLVAVGQDLGPKLWCTLGDQPGKMDGRFDIAKRIMGVMGDKAVLWGQKIELEAHAACFIDWPIEQIRLAIPDRIERCEHIKARVAIELGRENIRLQVLVEGLAQYLLVELDAVEPSPCAGRPALDQSCDVLRELEEARQVWIGQLRRAQASDRQRPWRRNNVRRDPATQIDPLDLPECVIRQDGRELQGWSKAGEMPVVSRS